MTSPPKEDKVSWDPSLLEKPSTSIPKSTGRRRSSVYGSYTRVVIVAVDLSENSKRAFEWYVLNAWKSDDFIVFVHCPEPPKLPTFSWKTGISLPVDDWTKILSDMNSNTRKLEEDYETICTMRKIKHKMRAEAMKNVGEGILRIAGEEQGDLVVCGAKGVGDSKRGTVAEYITRHSIFPVLMVPSRID